MPSSRLWKTYVAGLFAGGLLLVLALPSQAETVRVKVPQENFRSSPNGKILAVVQQGTELKVLQHRGRWYRAQLNGWLWRPDPLKKPKITQAPDDEEEASPVPAAPVELVESKLRWYPQDYHRRQGPQRAHLQLHLSFANNTEHTLGAIQYRLRLLDGAGRDILVEDYDSDVLVETNSQPAAITHRWLERGGPSGELYRTLHSAAKKGGLDVKVDVLSAYFFETGQKVFQQAGP